MRRLFLVGETDVGVAEGGDAKGEYARGVDVGAEGVDGYDHEL